MGTLFREVAQSQVDVEDLFYMLKERPKVVESPDAREFRFEKGEIEFRDVSFGHKRHQSRGDSLSDSIEGDDISDEGDVKYLF